MADKVTKKIVLSILKFMRAELEAGTLDEDSIESLEVAVQCLESAYNVERSAAQAKNVPDLLELFSTSSDIWAEEVADPVTEENKTKAEKLKNIGNTLMKEEKYVDAITAYTNAISLNPSNAVYFCNRAAAHSKLNDHPAAIQDCKNAIKLDPTYSKAYGRLGIAYSSLNQHEEAKNSYLKALQLEPDNESYKNNLNLTNEQIQKERTAPQASVPNFGGIDINTLLNNEALMNIFSQMLANPSMQNLMFGFMSGQRDANTDALMQAGLQMAQQIQGVDPELVENLRREMAGANPNIPSEPNSGDQNDKKNQ